MDGLTLIDVVHLSGVSVRRLLRKLGFSAQRSLTVLHRLQKTPGLIRAFFRAPKLRYAAA